MPANASVLFPTEQNVWPARLGPLKTIDVQPEDEFNNWRAYLVCPNVGATNVEHLSGKVVKPPAILARIFSDRPTVNRWGFVTHPDLAQFLVETGCFCAAAVCSGDATSDENPAYLPRLKEMIDHFDNDKLYFGFRTLVLENDGAIEALKTTSEFVGCTGNVIRWVNALHKDDIANGLKGLERRGDGMEKRCKKLIDDLMARQATINNRWEQWYRQNGEIFEEWCIEVNRHLSLYTQLYCYANLKNAAHKRAVQILHKLLYMKTTDDFGPVIDHMNTFIQAKRKLPE